MPPLLADSTVLALNSGSWSLKLALFEFRNGNAIRLASGEAEEIGHPNGRVWLKLDSNIVLDETRSFTGTAEAAEFLIQSLRKTALPPPRAVGHRIVHGGPNLRRHQRITPDVLAQLGRAITFAPVHLPAALDVIREAMAGFPDVPHIACFDSAFHSSIPEHVSRLPFAAKYFADGLRRYGFHGISCESAVRKLGNELAPRTVLAHLGNGCSLTAIHNGRSVENTMGLTPTGGVMMGTRSGDLDPGVLLYLLKAGYSVEQLDALLNHNAGLQGVSESTSDMRRLIELSENDAKARTAIEMFCYQIRKSVGALAAVLGGIDMLLFTGGIGEHAAPIRAEICSGLQHLGVSIDEAANRRHAAKIASVDSHWDVRVVPADEDLQIALHCVKLALPS